MEPGGWRIRVVITVDGAQPGPEEESESIGKMIIGFPDALGNRRSRFCSFLTAASQTRQRPRVPPPRSVIMHRDARCLLLAD